MKKIIIFVNEEEFDQLKNKYKNALYYESKKYKKLRLSFRKEIRCLKRV
jgi:hypothetical protein